jgi:hypothetical protein
MNARTDQDLLPALSMNATKDVLLNDLTHHPEQAQYLSTAMLQLRSVVSNADSTLFERISYDNEHTDLHESLLLLFVAVCLNNRRVFDHIASKTNSFAMQPEWHQLFKQPLFDLVKSPQLNA